MSFEEDISKTLAEVDKDVDKLAKGMIDQLGKSNSFFNIKFILQYVFNFMNFDFVKYSILFTKFAVLRLFTKSNTYCIFKRQL